MGLLIVYIIGFVITLIATSIYAGYLYEGDDTYRDKDGVVKIVLVASFLWPFMLCVMLVLLPIKFFYNLGNDLKNKN